MGYLAHGDEGMSESGEKDLSRHDEDVFGFKESLPLLPGLWMSVNFRTHPLCVSDSVGFNHISLLEHEMYKRNNENANLLLLINLNNDGSNHLQPLSSIHPLLHQDILDQQTRNQGLPRSRPQHSNGIFPPRTLIQLHLIITRFQPLPTPLGLNAHFDHTQGLNLLVNCTFPFLQGLELLHRETFEIVFGEGRGIGSDSTCVRGRLDGGLDFAEREDTMEGEVLEFSVDAGGLFGGFVKFGVGIFDCVVSGGGLRRARRCFSDSGLF